MSMTLDKLFRYRAIIKDIADLEEKYERIKARAEKQTSTITGMPHQTGIHDRIGDLTAELADLSEDINQEVREYLITKGEVEGWILAIPDEQIKKLFWYKFVYGWSFRRIGDELDIQYKTAYNRYKAYIRKAGL